MVGLAVAAAGCLALAWRPGRRAIAMVELLLALVGVGIGTVLPVTTVAIQNAVAMHQLGTATGVMSFFRSLGGAIAVAGFGALVLGGGAGGGAAAEALRARSVTMGLEPIFQTLFFTAATGLAVALAWFLSMEERPLRSGAPSAAKSAAS